MADETFRELQLQPNQVSLDEQNTDKSKIIKAIYGNLRSMVRKIAELRNLYGDGHGKSSNFEGISSKYAKLAVGSSIALTVFLWDTYKETNIKEKI